MPYRRAEEGRRDQSAPDKRAVPPPVHSLDVYEEQVLAPDGAMFPGINISAHPATSFNGGFEVWIQQQSALTTSRWEHIATSTTLPIYVQHPRIQQGQALRIALVTVSVWGHRIGPEGSPQFLITIDGTGEIPPDVTGFTAVADEGDVRFDWVSVLDDPSDIAANVRRDVLMYEVRAGATGWQTAAHVCFFGPVNREWGRAPRSKAPGTTFLIKAITRAELESAGTDSATLSAADATCLDNSSLVGYDEVAIPGGLTSISFTTVCPYASSPIVVPGSDNAGGPILNIDGASYTQNGDLTWTATLFASAIAPPGGWSVHLHEAGT